MLARCDSLRGAGRTANLPAWIIEHGLRPWLSRLGEGSEDLLAVMVQGWGLPKDAAKALLSKAAPYTVEGETVVFTA